MSDGLEKQRASGGPVRGSIVFPSCPSGRRGFFCLLSVSRQKSQIRERLCGMKERMSKVRACPAIGQ